MKRFIIFLFCVTVLFAFQGSVFAKTTAERTAGMFLIQVESGGKIWYVNPKTLTRFYLGQPSEALNILRRQGIGITNTNLDKIPKNGSKAIGNLALRKKLSGRIIIQIEEKGAMWYVYPKDLKRYYLGSPKDILSASRKLSVGITNKNLESIPTKNISLSSNNIKEKRITTDTARQSFPKISGTKIIWENLDKQPVLNVYDLLTNVSRDIVGNSKDFEIASGASILNDKMVYFVMCRDAGPIYVPCMKMYDLINDSESRIVDVPGIVAGEFARAPVMSGNKFVWAARVGASIDIFVNDTVSNITTRLTNDAVDQSDPEISGNRIVWRDRRNGNWDIYMYDLSTGKEEQITNESGDQIYPSISEDIIVWQESGGVYMYDLATSIKSEILPASTLAVPHDASNPRISKSTIIWTEYGKIYLHDIKIKQTFEIITSGRAERADISNNIFVWSDQRSGDGEIYMGIYSR